MANMTFTISGIASSAYAKPGGATGVPTIPRRRDNTYRISVSTDYDAYQDIYVSAYDYYSNDCVGQATIITGNASWSEWGDNKSFYLSGRSFEANIEFSSEVATIYIQPGDPYPDVNFTFNGTGGQYGDGVSNYVWNVGSYPSLSAPGAPTIKDNGNGTFNVSWSPSSYSNGTGSPTYELWDRTNGGCVASAGTATQLNNLAIPSYGVKMEYVVVAYYSGSTEAGPSTSVTFQVPYPTITSQPSLSLSATSGASVTLSWNAAGVSNQNGATIYYQYFVGPSSTYSDSYLIGTTTSRSATVSESQIISKCGTGFGASSSGSTCYFFVRAYWDKNGTTGGHVTPSGKAFTYYPTLNAPTGLSLSPSYGIETTISWTNKVAGNGSAPQIILYIDGVQKASGIQGSSGGYKISKDIWRSLTCGNHKIKIAHEWHGRYAYSNEITFRHESGLISYYDSSRGKYVRCEVRYYDSSRGKYVLCAPYMYNSGWKLCGK